MDFDNLRKLIDNGLSTHQIAKKISCSQTNVRYWLKKYNLKTKHNLKNNYCSDKKQCLVCDIFFSNRKSDFCSRKCYTKSYHKNYYNKYHLLKKRRDRKLYLLNRLGGACQICGYNKSPSALHFHHKDPNIKKFNLCTSNLCNHSWQRCLDESEKCDILCSNCHFEIHHPHLDVDLLCNNKGVLRKIELINLVSNGSCESCGYNKNLASLHFHHLNPQLKEFNVDMRMISNLSFEKLETEVIKCIVLCGNCHSEYHYSDDIII